LLFLMVWSMQLAKDRIETVDFPLESTALAAKAKLEHLRQTLLPDQAQEYVEYSLYERGGFFFVLEEVEKAIEQIEAYCAAVQSRLREGGRQ